MEVTHDKIATTDLIDQLEHAMLENLPAIHCPVLHRFTPGLYIREIFMPAGSLITSRIHNTTHPYTVSKGVVDVWTDGCGWVRVTAPFTGITTPGTRRILFIHEDTIWTTYHPIATVSGEEQDLDIEDQLKVVERIEEQIIEPHVNPLIGDKYTQAIDSLKKHLIIMGGDACLG